MTAAAEYDIPALVKSMTLGPNHEMRKVRPLLAEVAEEFALLADELNGNEEAARIVACFREEQSAWGYVRTRVLLIGYLESAVYYVLRLREIAAA